MKARIERRNSFVIRIWREEDEVPWQGWVQHAATGDSVHVQRLEELLAFIECRAGKLASEAREGLK